MNKERKKIQKDEETKGNEEKIAIMSRKEAKER